MEVYEYDSIHCPTSILIFEPDEMVEVLDDDKKLNPDNGPEAATTIKLGPYEFSAKTFSPSNWQAKRMPIPLPKAYDAFRGKLLELLENPLLPKPMAELIEAYLKVVYDNTSSMASVIQECASEMPERYETVDDLFKSAPYWINHKIVRARKELKPKAEEIVNFARSYFDSDLLMGRRDPV